MSEDGRRLSIRTDAIKKRKNIDEKQRKRREEFDIRKQKTWASRKKVELSQTTEDSDNSLSSSSSSNSDNQEEPTLDQGTILNMDRIETVQT